MTSFLFFRHETAYELRISDWSSDVCSSDLGVYLALQKVYFRRTQFFMELQVVVSEIDEVAKNASAIHAVLRLQFSDREDRKSVVVGKECVSTCRSRWSPYH